MVTRRLRWGQCDRGKVHGSGVDIFRRKGIESGLSRQSGDVEHFGISVWNVDDIYLPIESDWYLVVCAYARHCSCLHSAGHQ